MYEDSQHIKTMLVCNGFPANFLDDCVRNFLHRLYTLESCSGGNVLSPPAPHPQILNQPRRNLRNLALSRPAPADF